MGYSELYVNPVVKPDELKHYVWQDKGHTAKKIIITKKELDKMRIVSDVFYIRVE